MKHFPVLSQAPPSGAIHHWKMVVTGDPQSLLEVRAHIEGHEPNVFRCAHIDEHKLTAWLAISDSEPHIIPTILKSEINNGWSRKALVIENHEEGRTCQQDH